ncbi:uncharacterized protein LOC116296110 [Actinia tenebrosa]|uniref:Uncharacterized protein LOC116296110 n=1 Tax=Actinia tenebrosa TaxID=6105 RepID=A0A6P8HX10_ACTTE|nr:uncharacterized protein LOC116296110 [Actinia tenebrosa]
MTQSQLETRVQASEKEIKELRVMLEERTRDVSLIKVDKNNLEMQKREADMKIMELTNSLKNETAFQQIVSQRNQELELEVRQIHRDKTLGLLSPRLPNNPQPSRDLEVVYPDLAAERSLQQKVDNIAVDKIRTLHSKKAQLEIELEKERHERVKDHAELARLKAKLAVYRSVK